MHPVLFRIGNFPIAVYGPFIALGVLLGVYVAVRRAHKVGVDPNVVLDLAFYGILIGFAGSRVLFILGNLGFFFREPLALIFSRQGYVFFGGMVSALAFAVWFVRRKKADAWQVADVLAPAVPLAHAFGRIGCFFAGCCYGRICPAGWEGWGVRFPNVEGFGFAHYDHSAIRGLISADATHSLPVFPVQLYEAAANLLIFFGLMWLWRRRAFRGQIFAAYLAAYGTVRFLIEFLRGEYDEPMLFDLLQRGQLSQLICLVAVGAGIVIWRRRRATPLEVSPQSPTSVAAEESKDRAPSAKQDHKRHRKR